MNRLTRYLLVLVGLNCAGPTAFAQIDMDRFAGRIFAGVGTSQQSTQA